jgi:hypothetical protein
VLPPLCLRAFRAILSVLSRSPLLGGGLGVGVSYTPHRPNSLRFFAIAVKIPHRIGASAGRECDFSLVVQDVLSVICRFLGLYGGARRLFVFYIIPFLFICFAHCLSWGAFCGCSYVCSSRPGGLVNAKRVIPSLLDGILLCVVLVALIY